MACLYVQSLQTQSFLKVLIVQAVVVVPIYHGTATSPPDKEEEEEEEEWEWVQWK